MFAKENFCWWRSAKTKRQSDYENDIYSIIPFIMSVEKQYKDLEPFSLACTEKGEKQLSFNIIMKYFRFKQFS